MRSREVRTISAVWFVFAALIGLFGFFFARGAEGRMEMIEVSVKPGDTLWSIAIRSAPKADPRATIELIAETNGLSSPRLIPGQRLLVPRMKNRR